ncbi:MAG: DUF721 domain-containing protein [Patescibacteria group bacterium]|nr:DUF721 domain-containing protein [Patescibacteria group bacterium]MDD5716104.1 DUF721 domain-containing protein [Patescibacteria group bacterium]
MVTSIKDILQSSLQKAGIADQVNAAVVCNEFNRIMEELFGTQISGKVKALYVKNRTLTLAVMSSAVGQELKLKERELIEKLEKKVGKNRVERLRFLV